MCSVCTSTAVPDSQHWHCVSPKDDSSQSHSPITRLSHNNENIITNNYCRSINHKQQIKLEVLSIFRSRLNLLKPKAKKNWFEGYFLVFIICLAAGVVEDEMSLHFSSSLPCWGKNCRSKLSWPFVLSGMLMWHAKWDSSVFILGHQRWRQRQLSLKTGRIPSDLKPKILTLSLAITSWFSWASELLLHPKAFQQTHYSAISDYVLPSPSPSLWDSNSKCVWHSIFCIWS